MRLRQVLHLADECLWATAASDAWAGVRPDAEADEHPARTAAAGDAERSVCLAPGVLEPDAKLLQLTKSAPYIPGAVPSAA